MKKIYYITAVFATLFLVGCGDGIDLPGVNVETDLNKIPLPDNNVNLEQVELKPSTEPMLHEGLHTEEDFQRIRDKKAAGEEPWISAYQLLVESQFSQKTADTYPTEWIKRGVSGDENYMNAARGGTAVGVPVGGWPSAFAVATKSGLEWCIYPTATGGSETTYSSDYWSFSASSPCLFFGGDYSQYGNRGLFFVGCSSASYSYRNIGCRLQKLP